MKVLKINLIKRQFAGMRQFHSPRYAKGKKSKVVMILNKISKYLGIKIPDTLSFIMIGYRTLILDFLCGTVKSKVSRNTPRNLMKATPEGLNKVCSIIYLIYKNKGE